MNNQLQGREDTAVLKESDITEIKENATIIAADSSFSEYTVVHSGCAVKIVRLTAIAAGMVHGMALAEEGAMFYWVSSDSNRCHQLQSQHGKTVVSISAGKYWGFVVISTGEVYMWDGKEGKEMSPSLSRLHNLKRATTVAVGETHLLVVGSLYHPPYAPTMLKKSQTVQAEVSREELDEGFMFDDVDSVNVLQSVQHDNPKERTVTSLKSLCEKVAAECIVEP